MTVSRTHVDLPAVREAFERLDNVLVEDNPEHSTRRTCTVAFSSNGLFYPNTDTVARTAIWERNRFEWKRLMPTDVSRRVFVRDVQKQWYVNGINARCDTLPRLVHLIADLTAGYDVTCVGNSAGGYAAVVVGSLIGASQVICVSPHLNLASVLSSAEEERLNPLLARYIRDGGEYVDATSLIASSAVSIVALHAAHDEQDRLHIGLVSEFDNVWPLGFNTRVHGEACWNASYPDLLRLDTRQIHAVVDRFRGRIISPFEFSVAVSGRAKTYSAVARMCVGQARRWLASRRMRSRLPEHEDAAPVAAAE